MKVGAWMECNTNDRGQVFKCSVCRQNAYYPQSHSKYGRDPKRCGYRFCPNCGNPMDTSKIQRMVWEPFKEE